MKSLNKNTLLWAIAIVGKILLALTVWNLNKISNNLDNLNDNVNKLITVTATQEVRIQKVEEKIDKQDQVFEQILKTIYEKK